MVQITESIDDQQYISQNLKLPIETVWYKLYMWINVASTASASTYVGMNTIRQ